MKENLSIAAGVIAMLAAVPYMIDIVRRKTKPNVVTWVTWSTLTTIATAAAFAAHEPRTAYLTLGDTLANVMTVILGLKYGIAKFSWVDGVCQGGAIIALLLWLVFDSPTVAIVSVLTIDLIAMVPTLRHSWINPEEETWQTFAVLVVASAFTLASLKMFTVASVSYPLYLLFANGALAVAGVYRRNQLGLKLSR